MSKQKNKIGTSADDILRREKVTVGTKYVYKENPLYWPGKIVLHGRSTYGHNNIKLDNNKFVDEHVKKSMQETAFSGTFI